MRPSLHIRPLTRADLPFADRVRSLAGWNQTLDDWERFLAMEPDGCFLAEWEGQAVGTATTTTYGTTLAWIGMLLVHPEFRRRGIGRALLEHCLDHLRRHGVQCVKLDATPSGETVYRRLGFETEWTLARWSGRATSLAAKPSGTGLRPGSSADLVDVEALDTAAFGVPRRPLLAALLQQSSAALVRVTSSGRLGGFGLLRPGSRAPYVGPVVAASEPTGLDLFEALLARSEGRTVFWDIPELNTAAVSWAEQHGFARQRGLTRMRLGTSPATADPHQMFALAGPETG
jgi:ribosomal protein S18 acetylase RimI-like enzyme